MPGLISERSKRRTPRCGAWRSSARWVASGAATVVLLVASVSAQQPGKLGPGASTSPAPKTQPKPAQQKKVGEKGCSDSDRTPDPIPAMIRANKKGPRWSCAVTTAKQDPVWRGAMLRFSFTYKNEGDEPLEIKIKPG